MEVYIGTNNLLNSHTYTHILTEQKMKIYDLNLKEKQLFYKNKYCWRTRVHKGHFSYGSVFAKPRAALHKIDKRGAVLKISVNFYCVSSQYLTMVR